MNRLKRKGINNTLKLMIGIVLLILFFFVMYKIFSDMIIRGFQ